MKGRTLPLLPRESEQYTCAKTTMQSSHKKLRFFFQPTLTEKSSLKGSSFLRLGNKL